MNLKTKFSLYITMTVFVVLSVLGGAILSVEKLHLTRNLENRRANLVKILAEKCADALGQTDLVLFEFFRTLESEVGFAGAAMTDNNHVVVVHSDLSKIGTVLLPPENQHDYAAPVLSGNAVAGTARLFFDGEQIQAHLRAALLKLGSRLFVIGILALALALIGAWWLAHKFIEPIDRLILGMHNLSLGDFQPLPEPRRKDEMGNMIAEFNIMVGRLKELDLMKQEFVASVTHELRSPLTSIERFISLLLKGRYGTLAPEQQQSLLSIKNNALRLNSFVDDILVTAKLDSKRMNLFMEDADLREIVRDVEGLFASFAAGGPVRMTVQLPDAPVVLKTDRSILTHILSNLVSNAFKFTAEGNVTIKLAESHTSIDVTVQDTGPGIPQEEKALIFEKFFRGAGTVHTTKGTGLGLSIVKSFADLLNARIDVADNVPRGTIFTLRLSKETPSPKY